MNIQELYDALDALEEDARSTAEDFAQTGDLAELNKRVLNIGSRSYSLSNGLDKIIHALKFED